MSEYQYYEWQTHERPLTAAEQNAVDALSSHIDVTASQAIVTYNWGDFKHDPLDVLAKYFDAYLYLANWGTRHLAFRFPKGLLDAAAIDATYCDEEFLHIKTIGDVHILEFEMNEDEGFDEWLEERGLLSTLARLRDDILQGDYRALYIGWLKAMSERSEYDDEDEDDPENFFNDPEPPQPAGLKKLTPPLEALIDFLEIDPFLVAAAAERSPNLLPLKEQDFAPLISRLTRQECDDFLLKIVHAEPGAVAALRKRLLSVEQPKPTAQTAPRTIGELLEIAENLGEAEAHRQIEENRKRHIAAMQELAKRETQIWQDVERTLASGYSAANYDHATDLLNQLHQLAEFQGTPAKFDTKLGALVEKYKSRSALGSAQEGSDSLEMS
ncbi:MAG: hypothetical protein HN413_13680 [Chloroflexi bacterium]|jgi:hypothetical protein|nr:hypothetical protein [Chloroflexota bacterium]